MLWEVEIRPSANQVDREGRRVLDEGRALGVDSLRSVRTGRAFLIEGEFDRSDIERAAADLLVDPVVETFAIRSLSLTSTAEQTTESDRQSSAEISNDERLLTVLFKPGVTDNVGHSTRDALRDLKLDVGEVAVGRTYRLNGDVHPDHLKRIAAKVLANEAIEQVIHGPLVMESLSVGTEYRFERITISLRAMDDDQLMEQSRTGQLYLNLTEMQTIRDHFIEQNRDPTDVELETIAQTWSEHCSHKTLAGRIHYRQTEADGRVVEERHFTNMLKETIFAATTTIRAELGKADWCVSVFEDNAGIVRFDENQNVCFKVETHNHPSALEPYGGANTGIGGVIRDPMGTGLGARPVCNTDVFCFAPPDVPYESLPPGVLHPKVVARGVVSGVRDYGNRMGIPTVNGAVLFDERYLGNPLVYCGDVAMIPVDKCEKRMRPGDLIVAVGGRTGRDGIHGATFSSAELTDESEFLSGGAVQIGNAIMEKMVLDVILKARDQGLYSAITDCGAGGFSSAVGEMGEQTGAEVHLDRPPLKYSGLSYTEIWISEAQERMVLAVPPDNWNTFRKLCESEGVEATAIGTFTDTGRLVLKYEGHPVADLSMQFLHDGRPPIVREALWQITEPGPLQPVSDTVRESSSASRYDDDLRNILGSLNVCSKEGIIRQYDHEVQAGSVIKPLVGVENDGPSDAAVIRPDLTSSRGLVISCGINPQYGDFDPYWMAAGALDEAVRNCVAVGADPDRIAVLDNFCWGNTDRPEVLGSLVRAATACHDIAVAWKTPFISGKDSLNNEFSYQDTDGRQRNVTIPPSLLISALGQMDDVSRAVSMDIKETGNLLYLIGTTRDELGGSHYALVHHLTGGQVPTVAIDAAMPIFRTVHATITAGEVRSCHDLSEGGLAVAAAEMSFAGGLGIELDLSHLTETIGLENQAVLLFSESNTRFLIEVSPEQAAHVEQRFADLPLTRVGRVTGDDRVRILGISGEPVVDSAWSDLKAAWQEPLAWV